MRDFNRYMRNVFVKYCTVIEKTKFLILQSRCKNKPSFTLVMLVFDIFPRQLSCGVIFYLSCFSYVSRSYERVPPRPNVQEHKLLIVITDGQAQDRIEVIPVSRLKFLWK